MLIEWLIVAFLSLVLAGLLVVLGRTIAYAIPMLNGPVFVPSKQQDIEQMIKLAKLKKTDRVIDLGSGDGAILIAVAKQGFKVTGLELNPLLVRKSQRRVARLGLDDLITIKHGSFWDENFANWDVVFLYGTTYIMKRLETKLQTELKAGSRVVSNYFQFPKWQLSKKAGQTNLYQT